VGFEMMLSSWAFPPETKSSIMRKRKPVTRPMQTQSVLMSVLGMLVECKFARTDHDLWALLGGVG